MNFIKERWDDSAARWGEAHSASWGDLFAIRLEIAAVGGHLRDGERVLDAGCGNGFALFEQCKSHRFATATGIDFSEGMIGAAESRLRREPASCPIAFQLGDLRALPVPDGAFDAVYTTRALINLPTWQDQQAAIAECLRATRPGGRVLLSEAFWEPLVKLNALRAVVGLSPLVEHDFNRYLKRSALEEFLVAQGLRWTCEHFSSVYYLGTRLLREMIETEPRPTEYQSDFNREFYRLEEFYSGGDVGIQQLYVLHKSAE